MLNLTAFPATRRARQRGPVTMPLVDGGITHSGHRWADRRQSTSQKEGQSTTVELIRVHLSIGLAIGSLLKQIARRLPGISNRHIGGVAITSAKPPLLRLSGENWRKPSTIIPT